MMCQCEKPTVYQRPSGMLVCVNEGCGGLVRQEPAPKKARP